jgi:hypothetical protein
MKRIIAGLMIAVVMLGLIGCAPSRYNPNRNLDNRGAQPYARPIENRNFNPYF